MTLSHRSGIGQAPLKSRRGITLVEVLVAIFIIGVGLLALLTLFPLGALEMARQVQDDRAAAAAQDAVALGQAGRALLARTGQYVTISLIRGSADPKTARVLRIEYEGLALRAEDLHRQLLILRLIVQEEQAQRLLDILLAQIRAIKMGLEATAGLLTIIELRQYSP